MNFQPLSLFISTKMVIHIFIRSSKYDSFHVFIQYLNVVVQPYFTYYTQMYTRYMLSKKPVKKFFV